MSLNNIHNLLSNHIPDLALPYCTELWNSYNFNLRLTKKRISKFGDYRFDVTKNCHYISINCNLNPYNFLITYIHEVAHCVNVVRNGRKITPHGKEWKSIFRELMLPLLNLDVFPDDVLRPLANHMINPKASSQSDQRLVIALRKYDKDVSEKLLIDLNTGDSFKFNNRVFEKIKLRRSRVLCKDLQSGRNYLISAIAPIEEL
ncbi:MAG: SprT-like domain-containing protein [Cyclobacteriaceae bacterium]|nr:SprT-like domain-containing protein [Cyclobacteriaceae bacterium]